MKKKFKKRTIVLHNGIKQEYFINLKGPIAITKPNREIYVNNRFLKLKSSEQKDVIYHERGHSKFYLWRKITIFSSFPLSFSFLSIFLALFFLIVNFLFNIEIFNLGNIAWIILLIYGIINFVLFMMFNWVIEIIADLNGSKYRNKKESIRILEKIYSTKKLDIWDDWILHLPWKLRKKVMKKLD